MKEIIKKGIMTLKEIITGNVAVRCESFSEICDLNKMMNKNKLYIEQWFNDFENKHYVALSTKNEEILHDGDNDYFNPYGYTIITYSELREKMR